MFAEELRSAVSGFCQLSEAQIAQLEGHYALLCRWNKVLNLTSIRDESEMVRRHYGESLFLGSRLPEGSFSVADLGSGAGFPGLPLAILRPEVRVTLIESHQRKAVFLRESSRGLGNVVVAGRRGEEIRERFDWVVSRAVNLSDFGKALGFLGERAGLLTGEGGVEWIREFEWEPPIAVPWGARRFLWFGRHVSRET